MSTEPNASSYYRRRAEEARKLAFAASLQDVRKIHLDMASNYERLADEAEPPAPRPTLHLKL